MHSNRWSGTLVVITLIGTIFAVGTGAQAGPDSAHTITGATVTESCGSYWLGYRPCLDDEVFELDAVEGVGGTAIYRPYNQTTVPLTLTLTCMSFSTSNGEDELSLWGPVFRGSGVSQDGQTYYFVVVDSDYKNYDRYYVSLQKESGPCGTGSKYLWHTEAGGFDIMHAGDVLPQP